MEKKYPEWATPRADHDSLGRVKKNEVVTVSVLTRGDNSRVTWILAKGVVPQRFCKKQGPIVRNTVPENSVCHT